MTGPEDERSLVPRNTDVERIAPRAIIEASGFTSDFSIHLRRLNDALATAVPPKDLQAFEISLLPHRDYPLFATNVKFRPEFEIEIKSYPETKLASVDVTVYMPRNDKGQKAVGTYNSDMAGFNFTLERIQEFVASNFPDRGATIRFFPNSEKTKDLKKNGFSIPQSNHDLMTLTEQEYKNAVMLDMEGAAKLQEPNHRGGIGGWQSGPFFDELQIVLDGQATPLFASPNTPHREARLFFQEFYFEGTPREVEELIKDFTVLVETTPVYQHNLDKLNEDK